MKIKEVEEKIAAAAKDGSTELDLSGIRLRTLPESIGILENLQDLNLGQNKLTMLPKSIGKLQNLQRLNLSINQLTTLPERIFKLENLQDLNLGQNKLTTLPESIGKLQNLQRLDLNDNQLTTLPESINQLDNLYSLDLGINKLTTLPESIGKLQNLLRLDLNDNQLTTLPERIFKLENLQDLNLGQNKLTTLPKSIGKLQNLYSLDLGINKLTTLPESITKLQNLLALYLYMNNLIVVPESIGKLQLLTTLHLFRNQITKLPESISKLQKLQTLSLGSNQLKHIPKQLFDHNLALDMERVWRINYLTITKNPLESPPLEIAKQGLAAVRDYFRQLEGDTVQLYEAKLLIVGQGGVGKTLLLNRLIHDQTPETESTEGIDIHKWQFKTKQTDKFQANFWDFGGQAIYHATHQFFLTKRSLYLFVWEARLDDDVSSFDYWLNTIKVLSGDSPVLVIQNKIEARKKTLDQTYWTTLFTNIVEYHDVSAIKKTGTQDLKNAIIREIEKLPHIGDELPKKWLDIRTDLEAIKTNYIPYTDYQEICKKYDMDDEQIDRLSQYYHDLGVFLRFADSPVLRDTVFLKPDWATNAVYKVLDNKKVQETHGLFHFNDLKKIWQNKTLYPAAIHGNLLELMKSFELCFELPQKNEFIIPELLKPDKPDLGWDYADNLRFKYEYDFMPAGILTRFILKTHDLMDEDFYWKGGLVLTFDGAKALVVKTRSRVIEIWIREGDKRALLSIVRYELERINHSFSNLKVNQMVQCICDECKVNTEPHFFTYQQLLKFRIKNLSTMQCSKSGAHVSIELLLGGIETAKQSENQATQIGYVHGPVYVTHGDATFNKVEVQQTITNIRQVIAKSTAIEPIAKKKILEHVDNIFKEFTKEGAKAGAKIGYEALKEYMKNEGIPKALSRAVKVASGGWLG